MKQAVYCRPRAGIVAGTMVVVATLAFACGSTAPTRADAGSDANGPSADGADGGFAPIPCGDLTCAGATPYCLMTHKCGGFGAAECTAPRSDGGACPEGYAACDDSSGKPGCTSLYTYACLPTPDCKPIGLRTFGNCTC